MMARRLGHVENIPQQNTLNKLGRTYETQMGVLKRYRSTGQSVQLEPVIMQDGGQAVVGTISEETAR